MADIAFKKGEYNIKYVEVDTDLYAPAVAMEDVAGDVTIEVAGDALLEAVTLGALDDAAESDPDAASATIPSLLRGILTELQLITAELQAHTVLLTSIETNTA
jgi:hypothetical protein